MHMHSRADVVDTVSRLFQALDSHDWQAIEGLTPDTVDVGYPSKEAGPARMSRNDLVSELKRFLPGFSATHHLVGGCVVDLLGDDGAQARVDVCVTHVIDTLTPPSWTIGVQYDIRLLRVADRWMIQATTSRTLYEEGNRALQAEARKRAA